jgi:hypothetical protein
MKPSTGAAVRLHRNAVRDRPDSLSAFKRMPVRYQRNPQAEVLKAGQVLYDSDPRYRGRKVKSFA